MTRAPLASLLLLAALGCGLGAEERVLPPLAEATRGAFAHTLSVTGEVKAVRSQKIVGPRGYGRLKITYLVEEGEVVNKGQTVVRFDTSELEREIATLKADIGLSEQRIVQKQEELKGNLANLRRAVERSELALEKIRLKITDSDTVSRIEREESRLSLQETELDLARARQELDAAVAKGDADVELLRLELRKQRDRLAGLSEAQEDSQLVAPTDGLVILGTTWRGGKVAEGDEVWPGMAVMELPDLSQMEVLAPVHEVDAALVDVDRPAEVRLDAVPGAVFSGKVSKKAKLAATKRPNSEVKYFDVTVALDETDPAMKPGMTTKVDILVRELSDVLTVPREAVVDVDGQSSVFLAGDPDFSPHAVTLGPGNATRVVIEDGLAEGASIYLGDPRPRAVGGAASPGATPAGA